MNELNKKESEVDNLINKLKRGDKYDQLLDKFKDTLLNVFIKEDLELMNNAMSMNSEGKEIYGINVGEELILKSNINNEIIVLINNKRKIFQFKKIQCGKLTFERFTKLIKNREIKEENFKSPFDK